MIWAAGISRFEGRQVRRGRDRDGMSRRQAIRVRPPGALLTAVLAVFALGVGTLVLGGCSLPIADLPLTGTPPDGPPHSKDAAGYLPVNELPPEREEAAMNPAERAKIQSELVAARERQAAAIAAKDAAAKSSDH
jgi:hypothetical protein